MGSHVHASRSTRRLLAALVLTCLIAFAAFAGDGRLQIAGKVMVWGGSCEPGHLHMLAGSRYMLVVDNGLDRRLQALTSEWPEGYTLEAALDLPRDAPFVATPGLVERLHISRYLSADNRMYERRLLEQVEASMDARVLNLKEFALTVPDDLAGHSLTFRVRYNEGGTSLESWPTRPVRIIAPCDRSDTARVVASRIYEAWESLDFQQGVAIADSMLAVGLSDVAGWEWAQCCARACGEYDKAVQYLDRCYADYGTHGTGLDQINLPRYDPNGQRDPRKQAVYEELRSQILRQKAREEQKQP